MLLLLLLLLCVLAFCGADARLLLRFSVFLSLSEPPLYKISNKEPQKLVIDGKVWFRVGALRDCCACAD